MEPSSHIEITPGTCGGRPRVSGTRIRVSNIVLWTEQGISPDEIIAGYPHLTLSDVHAALAFYFDNRAEMDKLITEEQEFVAALQTDPRSMSPEAGADSLPS